MDVCRLCLSKSPDKDIYQLEIDHENDCKFYTHILQFCLNIEVDEEMQITKKMCTKCYLNVLHFYKFKVQAIKIDAYLRREASKGSVKHEPLDEDEVYLSDVPVSKDPECDFDVKYELAENDADWGTLLDDHDDIDNDNHFNDEDLKNEKLAKENVDENLSKQEPPEKHCMVENDTTDQKSDDIKNVKDRNKIELLGRTRKRLKTKRYKKLKHENPSSDEEVDEPDENSTETDDPTYEPHKEDNVRKSASKPSYGEKAEYPCEMCDRKFASSYLKGRHRTRVHGRSKKLCSICKKEYKWLETHILMAHESYKLQYACEPCGRRFLTKCAKDNHPCPAAGNKGIQCHMCDKKLGSKGNLKAHIGTVHEGEKTFYSDRGLQRHMRSHTNERPYKCTQCDCSYKYPEALKFHRQAKHSDLQFPCTHCSKIFTNKGTLYNHVKNIHSNTNCFECAYSCGVTFNRRDNCRAHEIRKHGVALT